MMKMNVKEAWKPVTISGVTGILMGAGTMYAVNATAASEEPTVEADASEPSGLKVASVSDDLSFAKAFEAARAEVGPGGVFTWRGHIYNTYTASEWKSLSDDDKQLFAQQVKPEVSPADVDTNEIEEQSAAADDVQVAEAATEATAPTEPSEDVRVAEPTAGLASWEEIAQSEDDVRVVGFREIEIGRGRSIAMQELDINGQRVAVIDVDCDGTPDLAMTDLNHNHQMDEGEVIDLHTGEAISFTNDDQTAQDVPDMDTFTA